MDRTLRRIAAALAALTDDEHRVHRDGKKRPRDQGE
jgi:hypothetical protein